MSTIKVNSIVPNSGTHVSGAFTGTFSGSIENGRLDRLESFSSSLDAAFATDSQLTSLSASLDTRINAATNEQDLSGLATKVALNDFTASYSTDSASFADRIDNVGGGTATDISALNSFTASAATTGSNSFVGNQNINGDLIITGSTLSIKKSTDSDPLFTVDVDSKRLGLVQGNGEIPGEFYLALSGSTAFSPRPDKTMFYGSRGFTFRTPTGIVSEITNNRTTFTGSLFMTSSSTFGNLQYAKFETSRFTIFDNSSFWLELGTPNQSLQIQSFGTTNGTWFTSEHPIKLMTNVIQLSQTNGDPGIVNVIGKLNVTGSMGISGSIIPALGSSSTSSFSLGSSTAAWKDIWVSQGTIHFLDGAGVSQGTLSTTANGIQSDGDIFVNSTVRVGKGTGNNGLNTAVGSGALQSNTSGSNNTAFGGSALSSNTTGELNTAIGLTSMAFNTTGYYNTAVGQGSLYSNNGIANTAVGVRAGNSSIDANNSTVMGYEALRNVTTGDGNTAIGYQAGIYASGSSNQNVYLGYQAGPTASITENFKLYIDFQQTNKPLIGGDFQQREVTVNGMLNVTTFLTLPPQNPLPVNPSPTLGSMAVSGSALYFYNGSAWKEVSLVP